VADVTTTQHVVALTFDDGPDARWTPAVLRILRKEHATATFFVLGPAVLRHPDLVRAERDQGAEIGCHGWSHVVLMQRTPRELLSDYSRCVDAVQKVIGVRPRIVRPPYGLLMPLQFRELRDAGYSPVVWDVTAAPLAHPKQRALALLRLVHPGSIVLLHDGRQNRRHELEALPLLIRELRAHGYTFVTVSQLLGDGRPQAEPARTLEHRYCYREHLGPTCSMPGLDLSA
jgi:peptidoglycan/xylan/chitin deacetylase (PgdA/CDA1 family)